ncbi:unnamed protein product [marine sediment metagenome]|uniref:Uncharacterized protein n=1 Tax=marine sediment metagenome TaxID=412755 RepID=X0UV84_9ZZZZ
MRVVDDTLGDFRATWHSTDPGRGYFEVESERHAKVFSDTKGIIKLKGRNGKR